MSQKYMEITLVYSNTSGTLHVTFTQCHSSFKVTYKFVASPLQRSKKTKQKTVYNLSLHRNLFCISYKAKFPVISYMQQCIWKYSHPVKLTSYLLKLLSMIEYSTKPQSQRTMQLLLIPLRCHLYHYSIGTHTFDTVFRTAFSSRLPSFSNKLCLIKRSGYILSKKSRMLTLIF